MVLLVDTSVWIDYFNGILNHKTDYLDSILGRYEIILGDIILMEILQGFQNDEDFLQAKTILLKFKIRNMMDKEIAIKSAINYRILRKKGITIRKAIDCVIATFCIENKMPLLHSDKDFNPFEKFLTLKVI